MEIRAQMRPDCEHEDVQPGMQVQGPPLQAAVAGGPGHPPQGPGGKVGWGRGGGLWGTKLDIANCYWSVELPPPPWQTPSGWRPRGTRMFFCGCLLAGTRRLGWSRPLFPTCCGTWGRGGWWWYSTWMTSFSSVMNRGRWPVSPTVRHASYDRRASSSVRSPSSRRSAPCGGWARMWTLQGAGWRRRHRRWRRWWRHG